jgi:hypothetical protein
VEESKEIRFAGRIATCKQCGRRFGSFSTIKDICGVCSPRTPISGTFTGNGTACSDVREFMNKVEFTDVRCR